MPKHLSKHFMPKSHKFLDIVRKIVNRSQKQYHVIQFELLQYHVNFNADQLKSMHKIIIIAFKGAIRDLLQYPHSAANCLQLVRSSGPCAIMCKSRATHRTLITCKCHVTCHLVRRDSSAIKFDRVEIAFI